MLYTWPSPTQQPENIELWKKSLIIQKNLTWRPPSYYNQLNIKIIPLTFTSVDYFLSLSRFKDHTFKRTILLACYIKVLLYIKQTIPLLCVVTCLCVRSFRRFVQLFVCVFVCLQVLLARRYNVETSGAMQWLSEAVTFLISWLCKTYTTRTHLFTVYI